MKPLPWFVCAPERRPRYSLRRARPLRQQRNHPGWEWRFRGLAFNLTLMLSGCVISGELFSLLVADVDLDEGHVHVRPHEATDDTPPFRIKDHDYRSIPILAYAERLVAGWLRARLCGRRRC